MLNGKQSPFKNFFISPSIHSLIGSVIILACAVLTGLAVWHYAYLPWSYLNDEIPEDNSMTLAWFRQRLKKVENAPIAELRLDMGTYQGSPNINKNVTKYDKILKELTDAHGIDCTMTKALMMAESRAEAKATSNRGAKGLMQLMPMTARAMGVTGDLYKPENSILGGVKYIKHLILTACYEKNSNEVCNTAEDFKYIFAAYNGGSRANLPGAGACANMPRWECPAYDGYFETRVYVNRVKANYDLLKDKNWGC
jgi:soluble lytic murein transglycosylase-like protein